MEDTVCVKSVSLSPWLLPFPNKYHVLNTWCVTLCGELPNTLRHLPSVRDHCDHGQG